MKRTGLLVMIVTILVITGCSSPATPEPTTAPTDTTEPTAEPTEAPTATEEPTATPTDEPTATEEPTAAPTEEPTATPTEEVVQPTAAPTEQPATPAQATQPPANQEEFVPAGQTVWQLDNDPYAVTHADACPSPYNFNFYGLVAVTPIGNGIEWRRQDSQANLQRTQPNSYFGAIPSFLPGYDLNISVSFTAPDSLLVNYTLVSQENAACTHSFDYRAKRNW